MDGRIYSFSKLMNAVNYFAANKIINTIYHKNVSEIKFKRSRMLFPFVFKYEGEWQYLDIEESNFKRASSRNELREFGLDGGINFIRRHIKESEINELPNVNDIDFYNFLKNLKIEIKDTVTDF